MKVQKFFIGSIIIFLLLLISAKIVLAASTFYSTTFAFGGKIIMDKIPSVTCDGNGYGPLELTSNVMGAVSATTSVLNSNNSTGQKIIGGVTGIYKIIPFYATDQTKKPKSGDWILGKADIAPDFKTCYIKLSEDAKIPYPVRKTSVYSLSRKTSSTPNPTRDTSVSTYISNDGTINHE